MSHDFEANCAEPLKLVAGGRVLVDERVEERAERARNGRARDRLRMTREDSLESRKTRAQRAIGVARAKVENRVDELRNETSRGGIEGEGIRDKQVKQFGRVAGCFGRYALSKIVFDISFVKKIKNNGLIPN